MTTDALHRAHTDFEHKAAELSLAWYGWGSPVGVGLFILAAAAAAALIRHALLG